MMKLIDLTGKKFGRLTVIEKGKYHTKPNGKRYLLWRCLCDCGKETFVCGYYLRTGHTLSCGCYHKERLSKQNETHGQTKTKLYKVWSGIKRRCFNKNQKSYVYYGQRGITMCDEWKKDFCCFLKWAENSGYKDGLTIERIDVNGNYEPSNCKWITHKEQGLNTRRNRKITYRGQTLCLCEWEERFGFPKGVIGKRLYRGWTIKDAFETELRNVS